MITTTAPIAYYYYAHDALRAGGGESAGKHRSGSNKGRADYYDIFLMILPLLALLACSDPKPPTVCGELPQVTVNVGDREVVEPCFTDPEGGTLKLSVAIADEDIVAAGLVGSRLGVTGKAPGTTTVIVTATDPDSLQATQDVAVLVPNRPPEFTSDMREADVILNRSVQWDLLTMFTEPDGEEMTFSASSSNTSAVTVSVTGSVATVSGVSDGQAQITLTATDPNGAEGTGTIEVTVKTPVKLLEDDFETEESLDDWTTPHDSMEAIVEDGLLKLRFRGAEPGQLTWAFQEIDEATDFVYEVKMMPTEDGLTCAMWGTGSETGVPLYFFCVGAFTEDRNWLLLYAPATGPLQVAVGGNSNLVELDEFGEFAVSLSGDNLVITEGAGDIFNGTLANAVPTIVAAALVAGNVTSEYDHVTLWGVSTSAPNGDAPKTSRPIVPRKITFRELDLPVKR